MSFPKYAEYKESGVAWLGLIPSHWEVVQSRRLFKARRESAKEDDVMLTASQKYGMIPQSEFVKKEGRRVVEVIKGKENLIHVEPDDFVISMRSFQGGLEWCRYKGSTSFHYVPITPIKNVVPSFFAHVLKSAAYISALRSTTNLIRDGQEIRYSNFVQAPLPIVPEKEQLAIANFLDRETAKIDTLIAEQERLIKLLQEKRQAVISHAVTKGLNPNAPMKDSGVEWLGEVPEHWEVKPLKHLCEIYSGFPFKSDLFQPDGIPVVRMSNIADGSIELQDAVCVPESEVPSEALIRSGDLLLGLSGSVGNFGIAMDCDLPAAANQRVALIRTNHQILKHFLGSSLFSDQVTCGLPSTTIANVSASQLGNCLLAVPPLNEQQQIEDFLYDFAGSSVELREAAESSISLLQERRSALISAAVTGQIDVRGLSTEEEP